MGEASANMAAQWAGLYGCGGVNGGAAEGTAVSIPTSGRSGSPSRSAPGGRVGKPARRRSRASRRAPVTLLNTDASNFRAMVQQFTGVPSGPGGGPVINFGAGEFGAPMPVRPSPTSAVMSFDHLHRPAATSSSPLQSQLFRPQQHQQYGAGDIMFLHQHGGFESAAAAAEDRLLLQSIQAAQMLPDRPSNGYNFG